MAAPAGGRPVRPRRRALVKITCRPTEPATQASGGVSRVVVSAAVFDFYGVILPPRRRLVLSVSGIRLSAVWTVIPQGVPAVRVDDYLRFPGDARDYTITALRAFPRHTEFDVEVAS